MLSVIRAIAGVALLLAAGAAVPQSASQIDPCRRELNERIAACANEEMARPGRNPSDFSFWQTCRAKHQGEYDRCATRLAQNDDQRCAEARENIDWVLDKDTGAQGTYRRHRAGGKSPLEAVIAAEGHNPAAQRKIRDCQAWAARYIAQKLSGGAAGGALAKSYEDVCARNAGNARVQAVLGCVVLRDDPKGTREEIDAVAREACGRLAQACENQPESSLRETLASVTDSLSCRKRYGSGCGGRNPFPNVALNAGAKLQAQTGAPPGSTGSGACDIYFNTLIGQLTNKAGQCGINSGRLGSLTDMVYGPSTRSAKQGIINSTEDPELFRIIPPGDNRWYVQGEWAEPNCSAPLLVRNQQESFMECYRTYVCGLRAAYCARDLSRRTKGLACPAASQRCLVTNPIPQ